MLALLLAASLIAHVLAGECGELGPTAYVLTASTMQARLEAGTFGGDLVSVVEAGYYADAPATAASMAIAFALVSGHIPSMDFAFVYSEQDVNRMRWPEGDLVIRRGGLALHFRREAPG